MKIAFYTEQGVSQVVLTPESSHERAILEPLHDPAISVVVAKGSFYENRSNWIRQGDDEESTLLVLRPAVLE